MPRRNHRLTRRNRKSTRQPNVEPRALTPDQLAVRLVRSHLASPLILHHHLSDFHWTPPTSRTNRRTQQ